MKTTKAEPKIKWVKQEGSVVLAPKGWVTPCKG